MAISSNGWQNLMRADYEASPIVGIYSQGMLFIFTYQSAIKAANFYSFSYGDICLSDRIRSCQIWGGDGSKMATEHTTAHYCRALKPGSSSLYQYLKLGNYFCLLFALQILPSYIMFAAIILFIVRVPVLSEHIQVVEPKVSTACSFLARTFFFERRFAVRVRAIVTYNKRPFGTFATVMPIASVSALITSKPIANPTTRTKIPRKIAAIPSLRTNLLIYILSGVSSSSALIANPAICPMKVRSPVNITTPSPLPSLLRVEKNATFLVYKGLSG